MGEAKPEPLRVNFDRRLKLEFHRSKITSDAGFLAYRELDEVLGLTDRGGTVLSDLRRGKNTRHMLTGLLRQSVLGRLARYEDVNDAERLSLDPAMRAIVARGTKPHIEAEYIGADCDSQSNRFPCRPEADRTSGPKLSAMGGTSRSNWPKSPCPGTSFGKSCGGSMDCDEEPAPA